MEPTVFLLATWCVVGGGVGALIGNHLGRLGVGILLGTFCGVLGWVLLVGAGPRDGVTEATSEGAESSVTPLSWAAAQDEQPLIANWGRA